MATPRKLEEILDIKLGGDQDLVQALLELAEDVDQPRLMTVEDLENQEPPVWYLDQFIQEDSLTILYGPPKTGKTYLALEWAHSLALGKPWLDFPAAPIRVLYCSAEGNRTLGERTKALRQAREYDPPDNLRFLPGSRRLFFKDRRPAAWLELVLAIHEFRPHLVILDTLARHSPSADVASNHDMSSLVSGLDDLRAAFGCSFLLVHHSRRGDKDYLGAQALFGAADAMIEVDDKEHGFELHTITKDLEPYTPPWNFKITAVTDKPGWATIEAGDRVQAGDKMSEVLELLQDVGPLTTSQVQSRIWGGKGRSAINVLNRLAEKGLVEEIDSPGRAKTWEAV